MAGRLMLVKNVIQSMLIHSITIYSWICVLLKSIGHACNNFIWNGDVSKRKMVMVAWKLLSIPTNNSGLGIISLTSLIEASNLKLCWDMMKSKESWDNILKAKALRKFGLINHHIFIQS